jgi:hypothetical protein
MYARRQKCDALQQPGHMRIVDRICGEAEPPGDLWMRRSELRGEATKRVEFAVVIGK